MNPTPDAHAHAAEAWTAFWADPAQSACALGAPPVWQALKSHWSAVGRSLAAGTRVLDLGCGAGIVGRLLVAARSDLQVTGVDSAKVPPARHPHLAVLPDTAMESLPFPAHRFGAAVSQFGYEYSQTDATAREIARVLAPGAKLSFLAHHAESAIVASTRCRLNVIDQFLAPAMCAAFCSGDAAGFDAQMTALVGKHPQDALITELARTLPSRLSSSRETRARIWLAIEEALVPERCVSATLSACCVTESRLDEWLEPLRSACQLLPVSVLRESNGDPIAWSIEGLRRA